MDKKTETTFDIPIQKLIIRRYTKLWFKYYWYKYVRRINILGFYDGKPIIYSGNLEEY